MVKLRELSVWTFGPHAITPSNTRFLHFVLPLAEKYSARIRPLELQAVYSTLHLWIHWEVSDDTAVHWRLIDQPEDQFEQGQVLLPSTAGSWMKEDAECVFALVCRAVLQRLAFLRGWDPEIAERIVPAAELAAAHDLTLVYDPPPAMFLWAGGGPIGNDPRTRTYLDRHHEHIARFHEDAEWWSWWLATDRDEANLSEDFKGRAGLRVTVNDKRITLGRVRPTTTIPADPSAARELADADLREALARLVNKLGLGPHPQLG